MYHTRQSIQLFTVLNCCEIIGVSLILLLASGLQFWSHELPCPLCLLQRVGFFGIVLSLMMNLRYGFKSQHYAFAILFAVYTAMVALRQIALHVVPGTGAYGAAVLGWHLYTWSFVVCVAIVIYSSIVLGFEWQYQSNPAQQYKWQRTVLHILFVIIALLILVNVVTVFMECGVSQCPDNPLHYLF